jgi:SpoVK/Ycf46/Vps4 family AAA+-type ATPase
VLLWILRLLVRLGAERYFIGVRGFSDDELAAQIGLTAWLPEGDKEFDPRAIQAELRRLLQCAERGRGRARAPAPLADNIARLAELVDLSAAERDILTFSLLLHGDRALHKVGGLITDLKGNEAYYVLATTLGLPEDRIHAAFLPHSPLMRSGLVGIDDGFDGPLPGKIDILSWRIARLVHTPGLDPTTLLRDFIAPCQPAHLKLSDYRHLERHLAILLPLLREALTAKRVGVNVFLHGPPGTGKSQLARVLAEELACALFEITTEDLDGTPIAGPSRLRAVRTAQGVLTRRDALLLFDEIDDAFQPEERTSRKRPEVHAQKSWINRFLEDNPVPTLWLANSLCLEPAFIRRFDMVLELPVPPRAQRERILAAACGDLLAEPAVKRIAASPHLAPAVITRAAAVLRKIRADLPADATEDAMERLVGGALKAQGHPGLTADCGALDHALYDPAYLQTTADLPAIAQALKRSPAGRLCLYGPPGTGKTAFAHWLAETLEVPLHAKRGSDLLSMWVGGSEENIANAFAEAQEDGGLLLLDEVDGFLQDRRGAQRSWEITLVNEMLTQMERFPGVFVATTNLLKDLDQAALRRFDLKVGFDYLTEAQAEGLMGRLCVSLGLAPPGSEERAALTRIGLLTPGDFAVVARQHRFRGFADAAALVEALRQECRLKDGFRRPMGFLADPAGPGQGADPC